MTSYSFCILRLLRPAQSWRTKNLSRKPYRKIIKILTNPWVSWIWIWKAQLRNAESITLDVHVGGCFDFTHTCTRRQAIGITSFSCGLIFLPYSCTKSISIMFTSLFIYWWVYKNKRLPRAFSLSLHHCMFLNIQWNWSRVFFHQELNH